MSPHPLTWIACPVPTLLACMKVAEGEDGTWSIVWEDTWVKSKGVSGRITDALNSFWRRQQEYNTASLQRAAAQEAAAAAAKEAQAAAARERQAAQVRKMVKSFAPGAAQPLVESEVAKWFSRTVGGKTARKAQHMYKTVVLQNYSPNELGCRSAFAQLPRVIGWGV